jgi:hypothetical protein
VNKKEIEAANATALGEARRVVAEFEQMYALSTKEMLMCAEGDPRLARIDGFELIDWHYALEQINALCGVVETNVGNLFAAVSCAAFPYARGTSRELTNSAEPELQLVA